MCFESLYTKKYTQNMSQPIIATKTLKSSFIVDLTMVDCNQNRIVSIDWLVDWNR